MAGLPAHFRVQSAGEATCGSFSSQRIETPKVQASPDRPWRPSHRRSAKGEGSGSSRPRVVNFVNFHRAMTCWSGAIGGRLPTLGGGSQTPVETGTEIALRPVCSHSNQIGWCDCHQSDANCAHGEIRKTQDENNRGLQPQGGRREIDLRRQSRLGVRDAVSATHLAVGSRSASGGHLPDRAGSQGPRCRPRGVLPQCRSRRALLPDRHRQSRSAGGGPVVARA